MNAVMQFLQSTFGPLVVIFTVANLASMGLQVEIPKVMKKAGNPRFILLVLLWGVVAGPALGLLINWVLPLAEHFAAVVLITSLAPCAPFLPPMVEKARGDVDFAGAFIPMAALCTVFFMPLLIPLLVKGVTVSTMAIAKPLVLTVLIPLVIGALIRTYAAVTAGKLFKPVKALAGLSTALTIVYCLVLYAKPMWETAGSFALLSMTLFMLGLGALAYVFGFGLSQSERSVMALGMGSRNIAAVLATVMAIPDVDPRMVAMVIMWTLWSVVLAAVGAKIFARLAGGEPSAARS